MASAPVFLSLPSNINAEGLLPFISALDTVGDAAALTLDFSELRRVSPAGLLALAARVDRWQQEGRSVSVEGLKACSILPYLQRMDVLKTCRIEMAEPFRRHDGKGRFVPVRPINHQVNEMGSEMALCVAPGGDE